MSEVSPASLLFVYGTLRLGSHNPHAVFLHSRCRRTGSARMPGRLFRIGSVYGALYEPDSESSVLGDVLELPEHSAQEILGSLDRYEGIGAGLPRPATFRRERVRAIMESGEEVKCWTWIYNLPVKGCSHVRHGDALARE